MAFLKEHYFSVFCIIGILWVCEVIYTQFKFKSKGRLLDAEIIGYKQESSSSTFAVYKFTCDGEELQVDAHFADKNPAPVGTVEKIYYLPGNKKGIMRPRDVKIKLWEIGAILACVAFVIADLFLRK